MKKIFGWMIVGMMLVALGSCSRGGDVTVSGGGATSGTSAPSGQGTGNVVTPPAQG